MGYALSRIRELKEELAAMPEVDPATVEVNKQGVIRHLAPEIGSLQKKGYPLERVVALLGDRGISITLGTLKTYLSRLKVRRQRQRREDRQSTLGEQREGEVRTLPSAAGPVTADAAVERQQTSVPITGPGGRPQALPAGAARATDREEPRDAAPPQPGPSKDATFAPREDTDDI